MIEGASTLSPREVVSLVQFAVFLAAAISLFSIWKMGAPDPRGESSRDTSIIFLAIACLLWSLMAVWQYRQSESSSESSDVLRLPSLFRTLFSTLNTAFIIGATAALEAYEESVPRLLSKLFPSLSFQPALWAVMGIFAGIGLIVSAFSMMSFAGRYGGLPDILLSAATLVFVLVGLYKSFSKRGFHALAWLSIAVVLPYVFVQFSELPWFAQFLEHHPRYDDLHWIANLAFKATLCLLFMALIVSWMYEKAVKKPSLKILAPYPKDERIIFEIQIAYSLAGTKTVALTEKSYLRVLEIALKSRQSRGPIRTTDLYHKSLASEDEVRQDIAKILEKTSVDPLFGRPGKGFRSLQAAPDKITIDRSIQDKTHWENAEFAKEVLEHWEPVFEDQWISAPKDQTRSNDIAVKARTIPRRHGPTEKDKE